MPEIFIPKEYVDYPRFCPICNKGASGFGPYGDANVPDARCPNCGTMERYRLLYLFLKNETDFFNRPHTVLDIAPRREFSKLCIQANNLKYVSADLSSLRAMVKSNITTFSFSSNSFDYLLCYHVLEHVLNDTIALSEIHRVLEPQGRAIIQVPIDISRAATFERKDIKPDMYEELYGQKDHVRVYGTNFSELLENSGFSVQIIKYVEQFTPQQRVLLGIKDTYKLRNYTTCEDIYIATKTLNLQI